MLAAEPSPPVVDVAGRAAGAPNASTVARSVTPRPTGEQDMLRCDHELREREQRRAESERDALGAELERLREGRQD